MSAPEEPRRGWDRGRVIGAVVGGALIVGVVVLLVVGLANRGVDTRIDDALAAGERVAAPDVTLPVLLPGPGLPAGRQVSLSDLRGRPVVLNVWASWCGPCEDEAPVLEGLWRRYRDRGVLVLGLDTQDLSSKARAFARRHGLTFPSLRDGDGDARRRFGTTGVPETFLIDREGRIALHITGPIASEEQLAGPIEQLL